MCVCQHSRAAHIKKKKKEKGSFYTVKRSRTHVLSFHSLRGGGMLKKMKKIHKRMGSIFPAEYFSKYDSFTKKVSYNARNRPGLKMIRGRLHAIKDIIIYINKTSLWNSIFP